MNQLVDARTVADLLGVPVTWVRESTRSGAMPHVRLGRYVRFDLDQVAQWVDSCTHPGRAITLRKEHHR